MLILKKIIFFKVLILNLLFTMEFLENGAEIFSINGDAQIGAFGGSNPALIGVSGQIFNNPALGNLSTNKLISFTFRNHFSDLAKDHLFSFDIQQNFFNNVSIGIIYRKIEDIPNTLDAFSLNGEQVVPIDYNLITYFDHWELATLFSISSKFSKYRVGLNIKSLMYSILNDKAYGIGSDVGIIHNITKELLIGLVLKNFPTMYINWTTGKNEIIAPQLDIGLSYMKNNLNIVSGLQINRNNINYNSGIKYKINRDSNIILGYNRSRAVSMGIEIKRQLFIINYCYINSFKKIPFQSSHEMTFSIDIDQLDKFSDYFSP